MNIKRCGCVGSYIHGVLRKRDVPPGSSFRKVGTFVGVARMDELEREVFTCWVNFKISVCQVEFPTGYGINTDVQMGLSDAVGVGQMG